MTDEDDVFAWLQDEVKPTVDARIQEWLEEFEYAERLWYPVATGGKRIRPGLVFLVSEIVDVPREDALDIAAGVELLHNFTLVHDDIIDGDEYRRGEPTLWAKHGEGSAINLGDMMFAKAILCFPPETRDLALDTVITVTNGEQMDIDFADRRDITVEEYMTMVRRKTGALLELCVDAPLALAETDLDLDGFTSLGPAFQIRDDLLDFQEGKGREKIGNDVRAGKRTLMVVHADDDRVYDILDKPFEETTDEDVQEVMEILEAEGSMDFAEQQMNDLIDEARAAIAALPDSPGREKLEALGRFITERDV
ncbi:Bifunctional short-chain isoprenyl diphosphate synthase protein [Halorhabdus tiamatea SARL4B]|nr:polyprenyl synthetase family protein [Halorhabdus tiamatea]ERJ06288.1 Bifunctional short-chain isoprenyl diphosphate synthase protein [Halorhabdus tiamatea SARL4B]